MPGAPDRDCAGDNPGSRMKNPWLGISLSDYEGHMASPEVAQAPLLADVFAQQLEIHNPRSLAMLG